MQPVPNFDGRSLRGLARRLEAVEPSADPTIQLVAEVMERGATAWSTNLGYGPGEALLRAHELRPDLVMPLASEIARLGPAKVYDVSASDSELDAMVELATAVRNILAAAPKKL